MAKAIVVVESCTHENGELQVIYCFVVRPDQGENFTIVTGGAAVNIEPNDNPSQINAKVQADAIYQMELLVGVTLQPSDIKQTKFS